MDNIINSLPFIPKPPACFPIVKEAPPEVKGEFVEGSYRVKVLGCDSLVMKYTFQINQGPFAVSGSSLIPRLYVDWILEDYRVYHKCGVTFNLDKGTDTKEVIEERIGLVLRRVIDDTLKWLIAG